MRKSIIICIGICLLLTLSATVNSSFVTRTSSADFDPLVDISVTVEIQGIRFLEDDGNEPPTTTVKSKPFILFRRLFDNKLFNNRLSKNEEPGFDLYSKVFINDVEFTSNVWYDTKFVYNPMWSATLNIPDDQEFVDIKIQLWNSGGTKDIACDISGDSSSYDAEISYSIKTGHWTGDDSLEDPSGYGRLCGCDDGTIYDTDQDCELWFDIFQNDYDDDGIPYWTEVNNYQTDPEEKNSGDPDDDEIPVEWEWKWGYDPFVSEDHRNLDIDGDSIDNIEEYLTSAWFSDPYRKDVFVEMDIMDEGPNGEITYFSEGGKELIKTAFDRQNVVFHLDDGGMGGHDIIPFDNVINRADLNLIYYNYFLHGDENNWRKGVFHYGLVLYNENPAGYMFRSNGFQVAVKGLEEKIEIPFLGDEEIVHGSAYMHELGHTFGFWPIPGHNSGSKAPWQAGYWINRPYKSCMNYAWMYQFVDYSGGFGPSPDLDDWARIKYDYFEQ